MKAVRHLHSWQPTHNPPTADDVRQGRTFLVNKMGRAMETVLLRPEDVKALGVAKVDDLPIEADGHVTPGTIWFVVAT